jgi:hypothetical protein
MPNLFRDHGSYLRESARDCERAARVHEERVRKRRETTIHIVLVALLLPVAIELARAGGPQYVAGVSFFDAGQAGKPVTWAGGIIRYYTDQGNLSSTVATTAADALVADAFSRWTSIPTAAVSATRAGQLAEDVNGTNVILNSDLSITMPLDVEPTAINQPVGVIYDADGKVTDALMGSGASADCFINAAFGGVDAFSNDGHFAHALVVLDGKCAQLSSDLPDLKYRLVRVLGRILGLGWSQLNLNAITGRPSQEELAGLPVMHQQDLPSCVPISLCYPNADLPKMDDRAALSRLYPVTGDNLGNFSGKQVFAANRVRIRGSVFFRDANGNAAQPMQGVNVVARWMNPATGQPSGTYAASSVSGFLFAGNVGNAVTGHNDALGNPYNRFGSPDSTVEGFFDLGGLELPNGDSAQYQLSVEAMDGTLSSNVGPYAPWQVLPSGSFSSIIVNVTKGSDVQQNVLMNGSAVDLAENGEPETFGSPRPLPKTGDWMGKLSAYGDEDYFVLSGKTDRTLSVEVTALDENDRPTVQKAQPVVGMWSLADPGDSTTPAYSTSSFNSNIFATTTLNAQFQETTQFRIGIADVRGDGRPDFPYHARVLYGDSVTPARISVRGGVPILIEGYGFGRGVTLTMGITTLTQLAAYPNEIVALVPAFPDGVQSLAITDPATGASSTLTNALTLGAGPNDTIRLVQGTNSATPVGGEIAYPVRVNVMTSDGLTPVNGATVQWTASNRATLGACSWASTCLAYTDESGQAETRVVMGATGTATITATLAPGSYTPAKSVQVSINATSSAKDLVLSSPKTWVMQSATVNVPLTARLLANGVAQAGQNLNWQIGIGSATVTSASTMTDGDGYGRNSVRVNAITNDVQGTVCVAPGNNPCQTFYILPVASSALNLTPVSGSLQTIAVGSSFQPITVRITNAASPPNPVMGVPVTFQSYIFLPDEDAPVETAGDAGSSEHAMKVLLASSVSTSTTDAGGLAILSPSTAGLTRPLEIEITATAGSSKLEFELPVVAAMTPSPGQSTGRARTPIRGKARDVRSRGERLSQSPSRSFNSSVPSDRREQEQEVRGFIWVEMKPSESQESECPEAEKEKEEERCEDSPNPSRSPSER